MKFRVDEGSERVEALYEATTSGLVGALSIGESLNFPDGVFVTVLAQDGDEIVFAVTEGEAPRVGDSFEGGASMETGTIESFQVAPDLIRDGVGDGLHRFRADDGGSKGYRIAFLESRERFSLSAVYAGDSAQIIDGEIFSTRTPFFDLPTFDRRDRELMVLLNVLVDRLDTILKNHEDRITDLEP